MQAEEQRLEQLFDKWRRHTATEAEADELVQLLQEAGKEGKFEDLLKQAWEGVEEKELFSQRQISAMADAILGRRQAVPVLTIRKLVAAASVILVIGSAAYFTFFNSKKADPEITATNLAPADDVKAPQSNKAMVTLADGRTVSLDSLQKGLLAEQGNMQLVKLADGQIAYLPAEASAKAGITYYNTLTNPRGSKVMDMALADGSHVWLNAGSSVTYPVVFTGKDRKVSISGEAYFEVAHDAGRPFYVTKEDMEVKVLGTHFNVNAYDDEDAIRVTLLEGSVKVSNGAQAVTIKPGEQARITGSQQPETVNGVDLDQVIAWKNGKFDFGDGVALKEIMRQVGRWYDVDIEYRGGSDLQFGGSVPRQVSVSKVLEKFEMTGQVHFTIEGRKVIVHP